MARKTVSFILFLSCCYVAYACPEGAPCNSTTVPKGLCIRNTCMETIPNWDRENLTFTITIKYPEDTLKMHGGSELFLRGNGLGYSWNKGTIISKMSTDTWSLQVVYRSSVAGYSCQTCADQTDLIHKQFEYRVLVDDRVDMIGANFAVKLPISEVSSYFTTEKEFMAYPWFYNNQGNISAVTVASNILGRDRSIALYTPPSFNENTFKVYPVIYVLDFGHPSFKVPLHILDDPIVKYGVSEEFIAIGFGDYNNTERTDFLTPTRSLYNFACINGSFRDMCDGCFPSNISGDAFEHIMMTKCGKFVARGGMGDEMLDFLLKTVFSVIQKKSKNRLTTNREDVGIFGYSLGGLISCHAAWTRPQAFGFAACQSPSFWWPQRADHDTLARDFDFINKTMNNKTLSYSKPPQRIYLDAGELESGTPSGMTEAAVEVAEKITRVNGYTLNKNVWVNVYRDSFHSTFEWLLRLWKALTTLLPAQGMPKMPSAGTPSIVG